MSDSSSLVANQVAVTSDLLFNLKPSACRSRSMRTSIPTSNQATFVGAQVAIFQVPSGRRSTFLDSQQSYLRFTVQNNDTVAGNSFYIDNMASSFISRIDIFCGSALLESVQGYNVLMSYLVDFTLTPSVKQSLSNAYGFGRSATTNRSGLQILSGQKQTFAIPILSGLFMGSLKMLPIGAMADDLRIEITWEQNNIAVCYLNNGITAGAGPAATTNITNWTITAAELELCVVELSDEGMGLIHEQTPLNEDIYICSNSWRHYVSSIPAATSGNFSFLVPARFASLKSIICCPRSQTTIQDQYSYSVSSRVNPNIAQFFLRIGSYLIPSKPITLQSSSNQTGGYTEGFMEIMKSFHSLSSPSYSAGLNSEFYNTADTLDQTTGGASYINNGNTFSGCVKSPSLYSTSYTNGFAMAIELESFAGRTDAIISGMNTLSTNCFFEGSITSNIGATNISTSVNYTLDFYANFDIIFMLKDGLLTAKY
jgi:hypothetical protein